MTEPETGCEDRKLSSENLPCDQGQGRWFSVGLVVFGPVLCIVTVALAVVAAV